MTVLHFVTGNSFGGVEGHICTLIKLLKNSDITFKIICHKKIKEQFESRLHGFDVEIIPIYLWPRPSLKSYINLIKTIREISPDILHCHLYSATRLGALAAKIAGVKHIIETIHIEEVWRTGIKKYLFFTIDTIIGRLFVDHYIAVSKAVSVFYQTNKAIPEDKITVIHNTTPHEGVKLYPKQFSFRIGFLGRLVEQKGVDVLIKAVHFLLEQDRSYQLIIGGSGPLESQLKKIVVDLDIKEKVIFVGNVSDKNSFFKMIDIFVLPSRFEGFPLVLLEAGMYQMPVVATNVSGNPEIIRHGETGLLVEKDNPKELSSALLQYKDEELRERMSKNLQRLVLAEFSQDHYTEKMKTFYAKIAN